MSLLRIACIALYTLLSKEIRRILRIWPQTLLPPLMSTALYFLIFGKLMGARIGPVLGHPYLLFIAPGLIMLSATNAAYSNVVGSFYSARFQRSIEELVVAPISSWVILAGYVGAGVLRAFLTALLVFALACCFEPLTLVHPWIVLLVLTLSSFLFALGGFLNGLFAKSFDDISLIPTFIISPMTYLGGVFYNLDMLPERWHFWVRHNPIYHIVNAFRYGFLGHSEMPISQALFGIGVSVALLMVINILLLRGGTGVRS